MSEFKQVPCIISVILPRFTFATIEFEEEEEESETNVDLISIQEIDLNIALEIKRFCDDRTKRTAILIEGAETPLPICKIVTSKISMEGVKELFRLPYHNSDYNLIDFGRKYALYNHYSIQLDPFIKDYLHRGYTKEQKLFALDAEELLSELFVEVGNSLDSSYEDNETIMYLTNEIEYAQGLIGIPVLREEMSGYENYDVNIPNLVADYFYRQPE